MKLEHVAAEQMRGHPKIKTLREMQKQISPLYFNIFGLDHINKHAKENYELSFTMGDLDYFYKFCHILCQ